MLTISRFIQLELAINKVNALTTSTHSFLYALLKVQRSIYYSLQLLYYKEKENLTSNKYSSSVPTLFSLYLLFYSIVQAIKFYFMPQLQLTRFSLNSRTLYPRQGNNLYFKNITTFNLSQGKKKLFYAVQLVYILLVAILYQADRQIPTISKNYIRES